MRSSLGCCEPPLRGSSHFMRQAADKINQMVGLLCSISVAGPALRLLRLFEAREHILDDRQCLDVTVCQSERRLGYDCPRQRGCDHHDPGRRIILSSWKQTFHGLFLEQAESSGEFDDL